MAEKKGPTPEQLLEGLGALVAHVAARFVIEHGHEVRDTATRLARRTQQQARGLAERLRQRVGNQ